MERRLSCEDGHNTITRNGGDHSHKHSASHPKTLYSSAIQLWETEISHIRSISYDLISEPACADVSVRAVSTCTRSTARGLSGSTLPCNRLNVSARKIGKMSNREYVDYSYSK